MSEEQSLGRKWRSREAAEELVREFEASGLRRKQFCAERGLSTYTLDLYRKRLRLAEGGAEPKGGLVRVQLSAGAGPRRERIAVSVERGLRVEIAEGFDEATLKRLLAVIEQG